MPFQRLIICLALLGIITGCGPVAHFFYQYDYQKSTVVGAFEVPATAKVGHPVQVTFTTAGPDSCWEADHVEVNVDNTQRKVEFTPVVKARKGQTCLMMVAYIPITTTFTPQSVGTYRLEGKGFRRVDASTEPYTWTAEVTVTE